MSDPVTQWQIVSTNPESTEQFYRKLFGWSTSANNALGYREVETGGVKGGIWPASPEGQSLVQLFVLVPDVARSAQRAIELGAVAIVPPTTLPDGDVMAVMADPLGLTFGMMQAQRD